MKQFTSDWFTSPVIGQRSLDEIEQLTRDIRADEDRRNAPVTKGARRSEDFAFESRYPLEGRRFPWQVEPKLWMHTCHAFGYIPPTPRKAELPIRSPGSIRPDIRLKRSRITITLDRLRVRSYPGSGMHRILFHFYAQNQTPLQVEELHYNTVYRVREGEEAALRGYPLFVGLSVGSTGVRLRCRTINVSNDQDEAFLAFLESDVVKSGLRLAETAQPAIVPFSSVAFGLAQVIGERHRNIPVQDIDLGLDFSSLATGARLATGSYLVVQMPQEHLARWDWEDWFYHAGSGLVLLRGDVRYMLPYNYLIFSIYPHEGA